MQLKEGYPNMLPNMVKRLFLTLTLVALVSLTALAQSGSITGKVTDSAGAAITGATVKAVNIASNRESVAVAGPGGEYTINDLAAGAYRVSATADGFGTIAESVTVSGNSTAQNFSLSPGSIGDTVTVTAGKGSGRATEDVAQTVSVTTANDIEMRRPASTYQAFERTPNLIQAGANPTAERPRLRGLSSSRVLITIDGERLNNVRTDAGATGISPSVVDVSQLESVEVLSGAGASLYGSDSLAGTINLITKAPTRPDKGQIFGIRLDSDYRTNEDAHRHAVGINWSSPRFALRLNGSLFRVGNYHTGNREISQSEVVRFGQFAGQMGQTVANTVVNSYAVWSLPKHGEIPNSQGHGGNGQVDFWVFPSDKHSLRYRQLNSQHYDLGFAGAIPPFDPLNNYNGFRRLDKYGVRYEGREYASWFPRLTGGFYRQRFSFPQDAIQFSIVNGSSYATAAGVTQLTGRPSVFTLLNQTYTQNKNTITSWNGDVQATFVLMSKLVLTTGFNYLLDKSRDEFLRHTFRATGPASPIKGASNPNSDYRDAGGFALAEYDPIKYLHFTGSIRFDNWDTKALVTPGFPLGAELALLNATIDKVRATPGDIQPSGISGVLDLAAGKGSIGTNNTIPTGSAGVVVRLPYGVNPYFRWANSYREPAITERYILRTFFLTLGVPNTAIKPERGQSYDAGVKIKRNTWNASLGYFQNNLEDFIRTGFSPIVCATANPALGIIPFPSAACPLPTQSSVNYFQRINTAKAVIKGIEGTGEVAVPLGRYGSITPFTSFGWLKGTDKTPISNTIRLINQFYNRDDTPVRLEGTPDDAPLPAITPLRIIAGATYTDRRAAWFAEWQARYQGRIHRADPTDISSNNTTQYGTFAAFAPFTKQTLRFGYNLRREYYRMSFNFGIENVSDRLYFDHNQNAPAPGRSFVFGITTDFFNLLKK